MPDDESTPPFTGPTATTPPEAPLTPVDLPPPKQIGPYLVREKLGEGGFGIVYAAEQTSPIRRRVALKVIKPGMDSRSVVARFEAERQALAVMDHPGVAKVFDAGTIPEGEPGAGRPFFVMEFVAGEPITAFCDRHRLPIDERVELLARVCDAVQHAHSKAVIHRDLKPTNILVTYVDGRPAPKVIDFGVAKALNQRLSDGTLYTERGMLLGTPEYMSPEQAEMSDVDIDTRADVYSIGVVLYELLTGVRPFDLRRAAAVEMARVIREVEPERPSTRLSSGGRRGWTERVASLRRSDPRALSKRLRADLDWVAMRCLEKERSRRYSTAAELAADLRRYLNREPVEAGPPSAAYKLRKFVRRHTTAVVASGAVLLVAACGAAVSSVLAVQYARAETQARQDAEIAERVNGLLRELVLKSDPSESTESVTVQSVLRRAARSIDAGLELPERVDLAFRESVASSLLALGDTDEAERVLRPVVEAGLPEDDRSRRAFAAAAFALAETLATRGDFDEADEIYAVAIDAAQSAGPDGALDAAWFRVGQAGSYLMRDDTVSAAGLAGRAYAAFAADAPPDDRRRLLAEQMAVLVRVWGGDTDGASERLTRIINGLESLGGVGLADAEATQETLTWVYELEGDHAAAADGYANAARLAERRFGAESAQAAIARLGEAKVLAKIGRHDDAQAIYRERLPLIVLERGAGTTPEAFGRLGYAESLIETDRHAEALDQAISALEILRVVYGADSRHVARSLDATLTALARSDAAWPGSLTSVIDERFAKGEPAWRADAPSSVAHVEVLLAAPELENRDEVRRELIELRERLLSEASRDSDS